MGDALVGLTEITNASNAKILDVVQNYLQGASKVVSKCADYSAYAVKGAKSIAVPRSGGFTVAQKTENTAVNL